MSVTAWLRQLPSREGFFDSCEFPPNCPTERTTDGIDKKALIFKVIIVLTIWRPL
jgi:hypothetical protein